MRRFGSSKVGYVTSSFLSSPDTSQGIPGGFWMTKAGLHILVLCHEQRMHFSSEPGYSEVVLSLLSRAQEANWEVRTYPYQRLVRGFGTRPEQVESPTRRTARRLLRRPSAITAESLSWSEECTRILRLDLESLTAGWKPDIVLNLLSWYHQSIPGSVLSAIRSAYGRLATVYFDHDEGHAAMMNAEREIFEASAINVIADSPLRVERIQDGDGIYETWRQRHTARFTPLPVDLSLFTPEARQSGIGLLGSLEGRRAHLLASLTRRGVTLRTAGSVLNPKDYLPWREYARQVSSLQGNIVCQTQPYRTQLKGRSFQAIAAGTCLLEERTEASERFFKDLDVWLWGSEDELTGMIDEVLASPLAARSRAHSTRQALLPLLTPEHFMDVCLGD